MCGEYGEKIEAVVETGIALLATSMPSVVCEIDNESINYVVETRSLQEFAVALRSLCGEVCMCADCRAAREKRVTEGVIQ